MPFGAPNIVPDMKKSGDEAMWQQVEYYMANKDDHTMMFSRAAINRIVTFLHSKAKDKRHEEHTGWIVQVRTFFRDRLK